MLHAVVSSIEQESRASDTDSTALRQVTAGCADVASRRWQVVWLEQTYAEAVVGRTKRFACSVSLSSYTPSLRTSRGAILGHLGVAWSVFDHDRRMCRVKPVNVRLERPRRPGACFGPQVPTSCQALTSSCSSQEHHATTVHAPHASHGAIGSSDRA